jgi:hypothetical protein
MIECMNERMWIALRIKIVTVVNVFYYNFLQDWIKAESVLQVKKVKM